VNKYNCIIVLGPTASGKTHLACILAYYLNGEIISADSRQVYKYLDIGAGKDLKEFHVRDKMIPYHMIDVADPSNQFYLHEFVKGLEKSFEDIVSRGKLPVICGGTGLYLDALRKDYSFTQVKEDDVLRKELDKLSKTELIERLSQFPKELTDHVDLNSRKRLIRGIEVAEYRIKNKIDPIAIGSNRKLKYRPYYIGIKTDVEIRRQNISARLETRLNDGLIEEVERLLKRGVSYERLEELGLEYKFVSRFLKGEIDREELFTLLRTAIFQFAKRQMTWFRKMEREGVQIHWVERNVDPEILAEILSSKLKEP
jgi:tRNA dimethylallyltransferase